MGRFNQKNKGHASPRREFCVFQQKRPERLAPIRQPQPGFRRLRPSNLILVEAPKNGKAFAMANCLKLERQRQILHTLLEGNSVRSTEQLTGVHRDTICRLLVGFGRKCKDYIDSICAA